MKYLHMAATALLLVSVVTADAKGPVRPLDTLYQVSTLAALLGGDYDGRIDFGTVMQQGDFGLGTFDALDGEMVAVDGAFYQVRADGIATPVARDELTPFVTVTRFRADDAFHVSGPVSCTDLYMSLQDRFPSDQISYAIRISGRFAFLQTRSVAAQEKPYPPLAVALQQQVVFDFSQVDATLAGFWMPPVVADASVAGFHFHAIITDIMAGGHVLDCAVQEAKVEIDRKEELRVQFTNEARPQPPAHANDRARQRESVPVLHW